MLQIEGLSLRNFCQHKKLDLEFKPGVTGIVGPNSSGKSNIIRAMLMALRGKSGNSGPKTEDISWGEDKGKVELHFNVSGTPGMLRRDLKSTRVAFHFGEEKFNKGKEVEQVLFPTLGISSELLSNIVFVTQGSIEGILFQRPSEREKAFSRLFNTHRCESLRTLLLDKISNISVESREEAIENLTTRRDKELKPLLNEKRETIKEMEPLCLPEEKKKEFQEKVDAYKLYKHTEQYRSIAIQDLKDAKEALGVSEAQLLKESNVLKSVSALIDEFKDSYNKASESLYADDLVLSTLKERKRKVERKQKLEIILRKEKPDEVPDEIREVLKNAVSEISVKENKLESYTQLQRENKAKCFTCHRELSQEFLDNLPSQCSALASEIDNLVAVYLGLQAKVEKRDAEIRVWENEREAAEAELKAIEKDLEGGSAEPLEEDKRKELQEVVKNYTELLHKQVQHKSNEDNLKRQVQANKNTINALEERVKNYNKASEQPCTEEEAHYYATALNNSETAKESVFEAKGALSSLEKQISDIEADIKRYKEEETKLSGMRKWRSILEQSRAILHRDMLPKIVAGSYITSLNARLAKYLEMFNINFSAEINENLEVVCRFDDGEYRRAERLSGGQKVVLGLSFRFAVYDLFAADLGLLILDEPTVYLDSDNIDCVRSLLSSVRSFSKESGMQLIVVTHEKDLLDSFDHVINFYEGKESS